MVAAPPVVIEAPAIEADLTFTDVQNKLAEVAFDGRYRIIGFGGAIRGTKTWGSIGMLIVLARVYPGSRWAIVRKDLPTLERNTVPSFEKLRENHCGDFVGEINKRTWVAKCRNGSEILFFPESFDVDKDLNRWKGLEVNGFLLEEGDELQEASLTKSIERAGAWIVPHGQQPAPYIFVTFNPTANWPKRVFYEPWRNETIAAPVAFIPATINDNPFLPESYKESLKSMPEQDYKRFVEGDWEVLTGRFYDNIDTRVHVIDRALLPNDLPAWWEYWGGYDWGYAHWAVMGFFARDSHGTMFLLDTHWVRKAQDDDQARSFKTSCPEPRCLSQVYAGGDSFSRMTARGGSGVTTAEIFAQHGVGMIRADMDRINAGRAVRRAFHFRRDPKTQKIVERPTLYVVNTPGNRRVLQQLAEIMPDKNDVNKPGKVDADSEGRGGDDGADMMLHGLSTHIQVPKDRSPTRRYGEDTDTTRIIEGRPALGNARDTMVERMAREHQERERMTRRGSIGSRHRKSGRPVDL